MGIQSRLPRARISVIAALLVAQAVGLAATGLISFRFFRGLHVPDLALYMSTTDRIAHGELPYRDFDLEYPPLALVPFGLASLVSIDRTDVITTYLLGFSW